MWTLLQKFDPNFKTLSELEKFRELNRIVAEECGDVKSPRCKQAEYWRYTQARNILQQGIGKTKLKQGDE